MRAVDRAGTGTWMSPGRRNRTVLWVALLVCALGASNGGGRCRADDGEHKEAFQAAWRGDIETMRRLIGRDASTTNARQCLPDEMAIGRLFAWRMSAGTTSVLHVTARQGHHLLVGVLLAAGAEVDARDREAATALHVAAQYGHDEVVQLLLEAGATIDSRRTGGLTPLHLAADHGHFPVAKRLLAAGADANSREGGGGTPLHRAASEGHENVVRLLLAQGADPRATDDQGTTPFEYAFLNRHRAVTGLLTARGIAVSGENSGRAALVKAARDGDTEGVRFLLSKGVDVNSLDRNGLTPLQLAIKRRPVGNADAQAPRTREESTSSRSC